jgi:hypothetical protein
MDVASTSASRALTRPRSGAAGEKVHGSYVKAMLCQENSVGCCSTAEIDHAIGIEGLGWGVQETLEW